MIDDEGNLRTWKEFQDATSSINDKYNKTWLKTEYDTAVAQSNMASKWAQFEKDKHLYPNLKYIQIQRDSKRDTHAKWHGIVLPIDHKFWDTHLPQNDWGCGCDVVQTDEEVNTQNVAVEDMPALKDGFNINAGKHGKIVDGNHPYFRIKEYRPIAKKASALYKGVLRNDVISYVRSNFNKEYKAKGIPETFKIGKLGINETHAKNLRKKDFHHTMSLLYKLDDILAEAVFEFEVAPETKGKKVLGMYKALVLINGKEYELGVKATFNSTNFYYLKSK